MLPAGGLAVFSCCWVSLQHLETQQCTAKTSLSRRRVGFVNFPTGLLGILGLGPHAAIAICCSPLAAALPWKQPPATALSRGVSGRRLQDSRWLCRSARLPDSPAAHGMRERSVAPTRVVGSSSCLPATQQRSFSCLGSVKGLSPQHAHPAWHRIACWIGLLLELLLRRVGVGIGGGGVGRLRAVGACRRRGARQWRCCCFLKRGKMMPGERSAGPVIPGSSPVAKSGCVEGRSLARVQAAKVHSSASLQQRGGSSNSGG